MNRQQLNRLGVALFSACILLAILLGFLLWQSANDSWQTTPFTTALIIFVVVLLVAAGAGVVNVMGRILRYDIGHQTAVQEML